jgi:hypothetical protein
VRGAADGAGELKDDVGEGRGREDGARALGALHALDLDGEDDECNQRDAEADDEREGELRVVDEARNKGRFSVLLMTTQTMDAKIETMSSGGGEDEGGTAERSAQTESVEVSSERKEDMRDGAVSREGGEGEVEEEGEEESGESMQVEVCSGEGNTGSTVAGGSVLDCSNAGA